METKASLRWQQTAHHEWTEGRRRALSSSAAGREVDVSPLGAPSHLYREEAGRYFRCKVLLLILISALKWHEALEHILGAASKHLLLDVTHCTQWRRSCQKRLPTAWPRVRGTLAQHQRFPSLNLSWVKTQSCRSLQHDMVDTLKIKAACFHASPSLRQPLKLVYMSLEMFWKRTQKGERLQLLLILFSSYLMKNQKSPKEVTLKQQLLNLPGEGPRRNVKYFERVSSTFYIMLPYLHSLLSI